MVANAKCWNCKNLIRKNQFFCSHCKKVQPPNFRNEFELLDIEKKYDINLDDLENKYLKLQQQLHPDKFSSLSEKEIKYSTLASSTVNDAYKKLFNSVSRANLLLNLQGFNSIFEDKSYSDVEVLKEIMDIQNKCMEITDEDSKKSVLDELNIYISETTNYISSSFDTKEYENVKKLTIKLNYLEKIKKNVKSI